MGSGPQACWKRGVCLELRQRTTHQDPIPLAAVGESDRKRVGSPAERSPSPTKRRAVNWIRVTVGEGRGEGEEIAPWGHSDLVCPTAGPPTKIQSSNGSKNSVTGARTSVSARCVPIREQPSVGAAHDTHRHVPCQGTFTQPSVAAQQRPWVTGHPIHWRILSGFLNRPHSTCLTDSTDHPFQQSLQDSRPSGPRNPGLGEVFPSGKWRCTPWGQTDLVCLSTEPPTQSHRRPGQPTSATGARSPSPTKRRAVNGTRMTVGEGRGEGEKQSRG